MSSLSRNLGGFGLPNNNDLNRLFIFDRKHIMCRLCNRELYSSSALITHIESHVVEGDIAPLEPNRFNHPLIQATNPLVVPNPNPGLRLTPQLPPVSQSSPSRDQEALRPVPTSEPLLVPNPNPGLRLAPHWSPVSQFFPSREPEAPRPILPRGPLLVPNPNPALRLAPQLSPTSQFSLSKEPEPRRPIPARAPLLALTLGRESFGGSQPFRASLSQPPVMPVQRISPDDTRASSSESNALGKRPIWIVEDMVSPIDGTRPFINQLDCPNPKPVDLGIGYDRGLDLTLKL